MGFFIVWVFVFLLINEQSIVIVVAVVFVVVSEVSDGCDFCRR